MCVDTNPNLTCAKLKRVLSDLVRENYRVSFYLFLQIFPGASLDDETSIQQSKDQQVHISSYLKVNSNLTMGCVERHICQENLGLGENVCQPISSLHSGSDLARLTAAAARRSGFAIGTRALTAHPPFNWIQTNLATRGGPNLLA